MRQSASSTHSLIPVRANPTEFNNHHKTVDALPNFGPHVPSSENVMSTVQRGVEISLPPSRVPVRALDDRIKSVFSTATMVSAQAGSVPVSQNSQKSSTGVVARAQGNKLSESLRTPIIGAKNDIEAPSPSCSNSLSPSFIIRNLDENPHTGLTPTSQSFGLKQPAKQASRLSKIVQLSSPPSPKISPEITRSRLPRRSKDDLNLEDTSRKLQEAVVVRPRRISIPAPLSVNTPENNTLEKQEEKMAVALAPLAPPPPISIPPNEFNNEYPVDSSVSSVKSPGSALASLFRWNTPPTEASPNRLNTPSTISHPRSPMTPRSPSITALEQELRSVSSDLAYSIRREMDLEDVITRLQDEIVRLGGEGKRQTRLRTSDYFSENSYQGSPPLHAVDHPERKGHSRQCSVAVEDLRLANEKVTQLEKDILVLRHENLELMTLKRGTERKLKDQQVNRGDSKKVQELESIVEQLRQELIEKTRTIGALQQTVKRSKDDSEEIKKLMEREKDAEGQKEALQLALRQLRERQSLESKIASERIKQLEGEKERGSRALPRTPERALTGITHRTPDSVKRPKTKDLEDKINQLQADLKLSGQSVAVLTASNTQLSNENMQLQELQQRLQSRLSQMEATTSASSISEASATASLSHAHRLAVEMARVTDLHVKSLEKVRNTANASLPHIKNGMALSPMLQSAYDMSLSSTQLGMRQGSCDEETVQMMENRIKELEGALQESSNEMGEVVRKMQVAQIEMIELVGERDEALRRERKLLNEC